MKRALFTIIVLLFATELFSQNIEEFYSTSTRINRTGMMVLGGWAISNMAYGAYGNWKFDDERKYFGQMNMMWNLVNAGIAGFALYQFHNTDISLLSPEQMVNNHTKTQNLYLINAGLDILYMAGGFYMIHASKNNEKHQFRLKGYGQSVILQGGFLFAFDLVMYAIQRNHIGNFDLPVKTLAISPYGLSLGFTF
ncbi:MAG: hypothetical protein CVT98_04200 [Bacteroidetes bacterium HGW-Bacteroidetes-15]|nr:MAG: hypothetical protein CVT98_04200 [Bacteroidetes bacterium HGW-Bacteroidetes-15]